MMFFDIATPTEKLSCFSTTDTKEKRKVLFLHGAGQSDKARTLGISQYLSDAWIESVSFDFSGHGESTKNTNGSIRKRVWEAKIILEACFPETEKVILCAFSMSGQVVMELIAEMHDRIAMCFLLAPALYHHQAIDLEFGENFTRLLRQERSYRENHIENALENYTGKIILILWDQDDVIPHDIPDIIEHAHKNGIFKKFIILGAPHMLALWTTQSWENLEKIASILVNEIRNIEFTHIHGDVSL